MALLAAIELAYLKGSLVDHLTVVYLGTFLSSLPGHGLLKPHLCFSSTLIPLSWIRTMASSVENHLSLLQISYEILLLIFHQMPTIGDACRFAESCSRLYNLFNDRKNKPNILRSGAGVPWKPDYNLESAFCGMGIVSTSFFCDSD